MKKIYLFFFLSSYLTVAIAQQTVGVFKNDSTSVNGYTLISNLNSSQTYMIDNCGEIVNLWSASIYNPGPVLYFLDDGSLFKTCKLTTGNFRAGGSGGRLERYDWDDNLIWEYDFDSPTERQHHDAVPMPNGNFLVLAWDLITLPQAKADGLDTNLHNQEVWSEKVVEIQPIGTDSAAIIWEWRLWDHIIQDFNSTANNFGVVGQNPQLVDLNYINNNGRSRDYFHANGLDYNPTLDQIIISVRNYDEFWIIDHSTTTAEAATNAGGNVGMGGDILYRWGNPETYQQGTINDKKLFGQHHPNWIPAGDRDAGKIMVFNNGFNAPIQTSKVQIINPPVLSNGGYTKSANVAFGPTTVDWSYDLPVFVDFVSGAYRMENGNTFITSGPDGHLYELDDRDTVVWEYVSPLLPNNVRASQGNMPNANTMFRATKFSADLPIFSSVTLRPQGQLEQNPTASNCVIYPNSITGLGSLESKIDEITIAPNPTNGQFIVRASGVNNSTVQVQIRDISGRIVHDETIKSANSSFNKQFDLSENSKGIYFITIFDGATVTNDKIILQ